MYKVDVKVIVVDYYCGQYTWVVYFFQRERGEHYLQMAHLTLSFDNI